MQAGIGVRYKPLRTQNVFLSVERLIAVGDRAQNDWLLRALYSWEHHPGGLADRSAWNYATVFADAGYFAERSVWAFYGEAREGVTWRPFSRLLVTPHVVVDARYEDSRGPTDSFVEGGGGLSLRYLFNESPYEGYRSSAELLIQYLVRPGYAEVRTEETEPWQYRYWIRVAWDRLRQLAVEAGHRLPL